MGLIAPLFGGSSLVEEYFAASNTVSAPLYYALLAVTILGTLALLYILSRIGIAWGRGALKPAKAQNRPHKGFMILSLSYVSIFYIAAFLWEPDNIEFLLHIIPIIWIVIFMMVQRLPRDHSLKIATAVFIFSLFTVNFIGSLYPYSKLENDYWTWANSEISSEMTENDILLVECGAHCARQLKLSHPARIIEIDFNDPASLSKILVKLQEHSDGRVFISDWLFHPENGHPFPHELDPLAPQIASFHRAVEPHLKKVKSDRTHSDPHLKLPEFWEFYPPSTAGS